MGYPWVADLNGAAPDSPISAGIGAVPLNIDGGIRIGPGGAFLQPALDRPNLTLIADTRVARIVFDRGVAVGVDGVGPDGPSSYPPIGLCCAPGRSAPRNC